MRGVPDSVIEYGSKGTINDFLQNPLTVANRATPAPKSTEAIGVWHKATRFLLTPLSLLSAQFSPQTAPNMWDIITQKDEWNFQRVLTEKGFDDRTARWLGFTLDIILDPIGIVCFFCITKLGKVARSFTNAKNLAGAEGLKGLKAIKGFEDATEITGVAKALGFKPAEASKLGQEIAVMKAAGADFEYGTTLFQQAARNQRAFMQLNIPFVGFNGITVVPREVSMMALGVPTAIRKFFTWGAEHIAVPGEKGKTLLDVGRTMFRVGSGRPDIDNVARVFLNIDKSRGNKVLGDVLNPMMKDVKLLRKLNKVDAEEWENIIEASQRRSAQANLTGVAMTADDYIKAGIRPELANNEVLLRLGNDLNKSMALAFNAEKQAGLPLKYFMEDWDYITHIWSEEGLAALKKTDFFKGTPNQLTTNHGSMMRRNVRTRRMTLKRQNQLAREGKHPLLPGVKIKELIVTNPAAIAAVRLSRAMRAVTGAQYLTEMAIKFGKRVDTDGSTVFNAISGMKKIKNEISKLSGVAKLEAQAKRTLTTLIKNGATDAEIAAARSLADVGILSARTAAVKNPAVIAAQKKLLDSRRVNDPIIAKRNKELADLAAEGFTKTSASDLLTDYRFPKEAKHVIQEMDRHFVSLNKIESISGAIRYYDAALNFLKGSTLVPFPTYHLRNMVDNIWRSYLAGVSPVSLYYGRLGLGHMDRFLPGAKAMRNKPLVTASGERTTINKLTNESQHLGAIGNNARDADKFTDNVNVALSEMKAGRSAELSGITNPVNLANKYFRKGFDYSRKLVEDPFRLGAYIDRRIKGDSAFDAFMFVNKHFFDYAHMTDWERRYMKRAVFFWSWTRNNIPYQIETLLTRPGKVGKLAIASRDGVLGPIIEAITPGKWDSSAQEPAQEFLAEWVREGAPIYMGRDPENPGRYRYMLLDGWISTTDLIRLFDPLKYFPNQLVPFLREPWAQAANTDFWFQRPIVTLPELSKTFLEREDWRFAPGVPPWSGPRRIVHVMRNVRAFNEWDRMLQVYSETKGIDKIIRMSERMFFGGSRVIHETEKARRNYAFRQQKIARDGRKVYLRAIRRNRPEEAKNLLQDLILTLKRGGI